MPFDWFVAVRFLREGRLQTLLIFVGVAFGVGTMVFLSALITGLQASLIDQTLTAQAHVVVRPPEEQARRLVREPGTATAARVEKANQRTRSIDQWRVVQQLVDSVPGVVASTPTVAGSAFAKKGNVVQSVALRGIDPTSFVQVIDMDRRMRAGRFRAVGSEVVIGTELADDLGLAVGDKLRLMTTDERSDVFAVVGVFDLGNKDVNQRWVFVSLRSAQSMLDLPARISTIEARVDDVFDASEIAEQVAERTGLVADSWMSLNQQLLVGLRAQNQSSYMIQFFVMLAIALGIASVLAVAVAQKAREIGILKATGTSTRQVMRIFLIQGGVVGLTGSLLGSLLGTGLALFFESLVRNPDGSPRFPVDLSPSRFALAIGIAVVVGLVAAATPARRAAKLDPATVIRYG